MSIFDNIVDSIKSGLDNVTKTDPAWMADAVSYPMRALIGQEATLPSGFEVPIYKSVEEITAKQSILTWTEDPRGGKLDLVKHPRFMEEAAAKHPDYADDCDGYANHWNCALIKSKLAHEAWIVLAIWDTDGHAVSVFRNDAGWWWAGNWNKCVPMAIKDRADVFNAIEHYGSGRKLLKKAMFPVVSILQDDAVVYGPPILY